MNKPISQRYRLSTLFICASFMQAAYSIGLGDIKVTSKLNEPFRASIELLETDAIPIRDLKIFHADKSEYNRAGLLYSNDLGFLEYKIKGDISDPYITVTSKENVVEPFINLLLKLQWPKGEVYRAYSILLDPPDYQLERITSTQVFPISKRDMSAEPISHTIVAKPADTLWNIAQQVQTERQDLSLYQIMISVYQANRNDFINQDINKLKQNAKLEIPSYQAMTSLSSKEAFYAYSQQAESKKEPARSIPERQQIVEQPEISKRDQAPEVNNNSLGPVEQDQSTRVKPFEEELPDIPKPAQSTEANKAHETINEVKPKEAVPSTVSPIAEPENKSEKQPAQQPQLQMEEGDVEDESNLWFLDTFNFSDDVEVKPQLPKKQQQSSIKKIEKNLDKKNMQAAEVITQEKKTPSTKKK